MTKSIWVATLALLLFAQTSLATPPDARVWLVGSDESDTTQRVQTELVSLGFLVVLVPSFDPDKPLDDDVVAVVDVARDGSRAQLWIGEGPSIERFIVALFWRLKGRERCHYGSRKTCGRSWHIELSRFPGLLLPNVRNQRVRRVPHAPVHALPLCRSLVLA